MSVAKTSVNPGVAESHGRAMESSTSQEAKLIFPMPDREAEQQSVLWHTLQLQCRVYPVAHCLRLDICDSLEFTPGFILKAIGEQEGAVPQLSMKRHRSNRAELDSPL